MNAFKLQELARNRRRSEDDQYASLAAEIALARLEEAWVADHQRIIDEIMTSILGPRVATRTAAGWHRNGYTYSRTRLYRFAARGMADFIDFCVRSSAARRFEIVDVLAAYAEETYAPTRRIPEG